MGFNWRSPVVPRVVMMAATIFLFCFFAFSGREWIYALFFLAVSAYQVKLLIEYLDRSNENIASFLDSIRFDDLSYSFKTQSDDPVVQRLHRELNEAMLPADMVLCRSGYTTLMDLAKLDKKAILIPTPGQSEQEYLGKYLMRKGYFYSVPQSRFNLSETLNAARDFPFTPFRHGQDMEAYKKIVRDFVKTL